MTETVSNVEPLGCYAFKDKVQFNLSQFFSALDLESIGGTCNIPPARGSWQERVRNSFGTWV